MLLVLIGSLLLMGTAFALLAKAPACRGHGRRTRSAQIDAYGFAEARPTLQTAGAARGILDAVASLLGQAFAARLSGLRETEIRQELMAAGLYSVTPKRYIGYRVISLISVPLLMLWLWVVTGLPAGLGVVFVAIGAMMGWVTPSVIVRHRIDRRYADVEQELPELIDLLVVTVEAGLGFSGSLNVASTRIKGALGDELRLALQEQNMGLSVEDALRNMLGRCETPAMRAFVRSVLQGEMLGVSIGQIMRNLADEMRKRRKAAAEERAQKAPIKILFPLIFMIFPAMFIVLLGPAIFSMLDSFAGR